MKATNLKFIGLGLTSILGANQCDVKAQTRPNVLIIYTDQQSCWTIGAYDKGPFPEKYGATPNIDQLAARGTMLTNHFTCNGVSSPSRGQFMTGRYSHSNGIKNNNQIYNADEITIAQQFNTAGYDTGYSGKMHLMGTNEDFGPVGPVLGFTDVRYYWNRGHPNSVVNNNGVLSLSCDEVGNDTTHITDFLSAKTIEFISTTRTNPFFYMVSFPGPHFDCKGRYIDREPYESLYNSLKFTLPVNFNTNYPSWTTTRKTANSTIAALPKYLGMIRHIDDGVGLIIAALKAKGLYDNTIIIFTSDHGDYMGEHGLGSKNQFFEASYRIPFIISYPPKIPQGQVISKFVLNTDIMPTLLNMAGITPNARIHGKDVSPILEGKDVKSDDMCIQIVGSDSSMAGIITPDFHLIIKDKALVGDNQLFDRKNDLNETNNLYYDPRYMKIKRKLIKYISNHFEEYKIEEYNWVKTNL
jgi:arylsulfatase A-like enzyme